MKKIELRYWEYERDWETGNIQFPVGATFGQLDDLQIGDTIEVRFPDFDEDHQYELFEVVMFFNDKVILKYLG